MKHYLVRATMIPEIVKKIARQYKISEEEALHKFYTSKTAEALSDDDTGLYGQSALYIYGLYMDEVENIRKV